MSHQHIVDPLVAFTETVLVPNPEKVNEAAVYAASTAVKAARAAGRVPLLVEVTVRVTPQ